MQFSERMPLHQIKFSNMEYRLENLEWYLANPRSHLNLRGVQKLYIFLLVSWWDFIRMIHSGKILLAKVKKKTVQSFSGSNQYSLVIFIVLCPSRIVTKRTVFFFLTFKMNVSSNLRILNNKKANKQKSKTKKKQAKNLNK